MEGVIICLTNYAAKPGLLYWKFWRWWLLLGVLGAMLLPSLDSAAGRAKNARLESDLATIDNAILLYKMDNGTCPSALSDLVDEYIAKGKKFEDATGTELVYTLSGDKLTYTLKGKNADGEPVMSDGSSDAEE